MKNRFTYAIGSVGWNISSIDQFALRHDISSLFFNDRVGSPDKGIGKDEGDEEKDYGGGERDLHVFSLVTVVRVARKIRG